MTPFSSTALNFTIFYQVKFIEDRNFLSVLFTAVFSVLITLIWWSINVKITLFTVNGIMKLLAKIYKLLVNRDYASY